MPEQSSCKAIRRTVIPSNMQGISSGGDYKRLQKCNGCINASSEEKIFAVSKLSCPRAWLLAGAIVVTEHAGHFGDHPRQNYSEAEKRLTAKNSVTDCSYKDGPKKKRKTSESLSDMAPCMRCDMKGRPGENFRQDRPARMEVLTKFEDFHLSILSE